jgi:hypothetical protein
MEKTETKIPIFRNAFKKIYKVFFFLTVYKFLKLWWKILKKIELQNHPKMLFFLPKKVFIQLCSTKPFTTQDAVVPVRNSYTSFVNRIFLHNMPDKEDNWINLLCHVLARRTQTCANLDKGAGHNCTILPSMQNRTKVFHKSCAYHWGYQELNNNNQSANILWHKPMAKNLTLTMITRYKWRWNKVWTLQEYEMQGGEGECLMGKWISQIGF